MATPPTTPPTRLGQILAGKAQTPATPESHASVTPIRRTVVGGRRGEDVTLPVLGRVWLELPGARAWQEIEAAVRREMRRLEVGESSFATQAAYEVELAMRVLAEAARDADDHALPMGTVEDWGTLDNDVINAAWHAFGDVRERLDPVSQPLSAEEMIAIGVAVKKKAVVSLRSYGVVKLTAWLATTDDPPSTSPTPSSPSSESPPAF